LDSAHFFEPLYILSFVRQYTQQKKNFHILMVYRPTWNQVHANNSTKKSFKPQLKLNVINAMVFCITREDPDTFMAV